TETQPIGHLDPFPEFGDGPVRIHPEQVARNLLRLVGFQGAYIDAAVVVGLQVVETLQRAAFKLRENVAALPGLLIPVHQASAAANKAAAFIQSQSANALALWYQHLDRALRLAPINAAVAAHIAEIQPFLFIDARSFDQGVATGKYFDRHHG